MKQAIDILNTGNTIYCEKTETRMFEGKMITVTIRANRPSPEALKKYAQGMVHIVRQCEVRGHTEYTGYTGK